MRRLILALALLAVLALPGQANCIAGYPCEKNPTCTNDAGCLGDDCVCCDGVCAHACE